MALDRSINQNKSKRNLYLKEISKKISWFRNHLGLTSSVVINILLVLGVLVLAAVGLNFYQQTEQEISSEQAIQSEISQELERVEQELQQATASISAFLAEDQFVRNEALQAEITEIETVFDSAVESYEELLSLGGTVQQNQAMYRQFSQILAHLSERDYESATEVLTELDSEIAKRQVVVPTIAANIPAIQEAPSSGSRRQVVTTEFGTYQVDVIAADLNSTRVVVETASEGDCRDNCPVSSLADFISRSGGFAGINGPYFCPAEYPSCAGKTNSFDTLIMNRHKTYFNSDNNVYSTVPAVIFSGNSARFVGQSLEWGRDTGVDSVIAAQPMLLSGGQVRFTGDGDPKKGSVGSRSFIGTKGSTVYIGVVRGATVAEVSYVLQAMGLENGLNLDSGGSTALYADGRYLAGPGRNTPFGIVLVRK